MSAARNDGGPAFPRPASPAHQHGMHDPQAGMTLRDYFAAKALPQAWAAEFAEMDRYNSGRVTDRDVSELQVAKRAYRIADSMMEARNG